MAGTSISELRQEVSQLRSLVIGLVGRDPEGRYRPGFVRKILQAARQRPTRSFKDAKSFLAEVRRA